MKTFLQFITESSATQQAARLGLVSDGHGGWTDRTTGEFVAKTVKGKGSSIMENKKNWHYWNPMSDEEIEKTRKELV